MLAAIWKKRWRNRIQISSQISSVNDQMDDNGHDQENNNVISLKKVLYSLQNALEFATLFNPQNSPMR